MFFPRGKTYDKSRILFDDGATKTGTSCVLFGKNLNVTESRSKWPAHPPLFFQLQLFNLQNAQELEHTLSKLFHRFWSCVPLNNNRTCFCEIFLWQCSLKFVYSIRKSYLCSNYCAISSSCELESLKWYLLWSLGTHAYIYIKLARASSKGCLVFILIIIQTDVYQWTFSDHKS